jgi:hypothetical protein
MMKLLKSLFKGLGKKESSIDLIGNETLDTKKCLYCLRRVKVYNYKCPYCRRYDFQFNH